MRFFRMNPIVYICFMLACFIAITVYPKIWNYSEPVREKIWNKVEETVDHSREVSDGEVGGKPTEDTYVVSTYEQLQIAMENDYTFTVKCSMARLPVSSMESKHYSWRAVTLDDYRIPALINWDNIVEDERNIYFLPVCRVVKTEPEIKSKFIERYGEDAIADYYLDMDGEANSTYKTVGDVVFLVLICILAVVFCGLVFLSVPALTFWFVHIFAKWTGSLE